jgi:hypothetical protein
VCLGTDGPLCRLTLKVGGCGAKTMEETNHAGSAVPLDRRVSCHFARQQLIEVFGSRLPTGSVDICQQ